MTQEQANAIESYANAKVNMAMANQNLINLFGPIEKPEAPPATSSEPESQQE